MIKRGDIINGAMISGLSAGSQFEYNGVLYFVLGSDKRIVDSNNITPAFDFDINCTNILVINNNAILGRNVPVNDVFVQDGNYYLKLANGIAKIVFSETGPIVCWVSSEVSDEKLNSPVDKIIGTISFPSLD